jgi:hypothetical protein
VNAENNRNPELKPPAPCERCGGFSKLVERLPKALGTPTYEIFRCVSCGAFDWVVREEP